MNTPNLRTYKSSQEQGKNVHDTGMKSGYAKADANSKATNETVEHSVSGPPKTDLGGENTGS